MFKLTAISTFASLRMNTSLVHTSVMDASFPTTEFGAANLKIGRIFTNFWEFSSYLSTCNSPLYPGYSAVHHYCVVFVALKQCGLNRPATTIGRPCWLSLLAKECVLLQASYAKAKVKIPFPPTGPSSKLAWGFQSSTWIFCVLIPKWSSAVWLTLRVLTHIEFHPSSPQLRSQEALWCVVIIRGHAQTLIGFRAFFCRSQYQVIRPTFLILFKSVVNPWHRQLLPHATPPFWALRPIFNLRSLYFEALN